MREQSDLLSIIHLKKYNMQVLDITIPNTEDRRTASFQLYYYGRSTLIQTIRYFILIYSA